MGDSLIRTNKVKQGLEVLLEALKLSEKFGMDKHYITAFVLQDLGWGYFKKQDYHAALKYAEKALILRRELYGSQNYHELAESLHNLGDIYLALKNRKKALNLYQEALDMYIALSLEHLPQVNDIKQQIASLTSSS